MGEPHDDKEPWTWADAYVTVLSMVFLILIAVLILAAIGSTAAWLAG